MLLSSRRGWAPPPPAAPGAPAPALLPPAPTLRATLLPATSALSTRDLEGSAGLTHVVAHVPLLWELALACAALPAAGACPAMAALALALREVVLYMAGVQLWLERGGEAGDVWGSGRAVAWASVPGQQQEGSSARAGSSSSSGSSTHATLHTASSRAQQLLRTLRTRRY